MTCEREHHRFARGSIAHAEAAEAYCEAILEARERVASVPGGVFPVVMRRLFERVAWAMTDGEILALSSLDESKDGRRDAAPTEPGEDAMGEGHSTLAKFGARREPPAAAALPDAERVGLAAAEVDRKAAAQLRLRGDSCASRMIDAMLDAHARGLWLTRAELVEATGYSASTVKGVLIRMDRAGVAHARKRRVPGHKGRPFVEYTVKSEHTEGASR